MIEGQNNTEIDGTFPNGTYIILSIDSKWGHNSWYYPRKWEKKCSYRWELVNWVSSVLEELLSDTRDLFSISDTKIPIKSKKMIFEEIRGLTFEGIREYVSSIENPFGSNVLFYDPTNVWDLLVDNYMPYRS